eukprot:3323592-Amphidinium_carterae.2
MCGSGDRCSPEERRFFCGSCPTALFFMGKQGHISTIVRVIAQDGIERQYLQGHTLQAHNAIETRPKPEPHSEAINTICNH